MSSSPTIKAAIIDYGLGNLFSVKHACEWAGIQSEITSDKNALLAADIVILPGVGAFGDAMQFLQAKDLVSPIHDVVASGKILVGICLGLQLMLNESFEFGRHKGLGLFEGSVVRFENPRDENGRALKVPQIGWNSIHPPTPDYSWDNSPLAGLKDGTYQYFVHSYYIQPQNDAARLSMSRYGQIEFCSALWLNNIFACQYHPERSGPEGLKVYQNLAAIAQAKAQVAS